MTIKIKIFTIDDKGQDKQEIGHFYIPTEADSEWIKRKVPDLIHGAQVLCDELPDEEAQK